MPISIDWGTKVISVPQSYLTFVSGSIYELDVDQFRLDLKDLEDSEEGMVFPDTHVHNTTVELSGTTYARFVIITNGYTVTFEDGNYTVKCVGANHNIGDVKNVNSVSLIIGNSAGLIQSGVSGLTTEESQQLSGAYTAALLARKIGTNKAVIVENVDDTKTVTIYDDDEATPLHVHDISSDGLTRDPQ